MENNTVMVTSASDYTIVVNIPDLPLHRVWKKRGAKYPIERNKLIQAYYDPSVEALFREGMLTTKDVDFLKEVGLMEEDGSTEVVELTDTLMMRLIKTMPLTQVKQELKALSRTQLEEVADFAVAHYTDLQMDRIDVLSKATNKNLLEAVKNHKAAMED